MGHNTHEDVARRWVSRALGHDDRSALNSANLHDRGDRIFSYGSHFEVARILRDRHGKPVSWLLNGNTYSVTTSRHQGAVRSAIAGHGIPAVTIPHAALAEAGILLDTIEIVDVQRDWSTETVITRQDVPGRWEYATAYENGGWQNSLTGEFVGSSWTWDRSSKPAQETCEACSEPLPWRYGEGGWDAHQERLAQREAHVRLRHGVWEQVSTRRYRNGHKHMVSGPRGGTTWELVDDPTAPLGYVFERTVHRHWLGASLIRAAVLAPVMRRHAACGGTGQADEPWFTYAGADGIGPLTADMMSYKLDSHAYRAERYGTDDPFSWGIETSSRHTECRGCGGRGRVRDTRRRWAYFLSGFDTNETRPSYFFCELPRGPRPTTVAEAYDALKPESVRLAESMGRTVQRQGDIFAVPLPGLTLAELKQQGGVVEKGGNLLGTNHVATDVVRIGGQTYARGTIRHAPAFRRPDHKRVTIGRSWHLIVKNTVPVTV